MQWSEDGAPRCAAYGDIYFQPGRGLFESRHVFLAGNRLPERLSTPGVFRVAELGFGTGLNFLMTAAAFRAAAPPGARLVYAAVEKHPVERADLARLHDFWPEFAGDAALLLRQYPPLVEGFHRLRFPSGIDLLLLFGDVAEVLPEMTGRFDAWYLDGFSPAKNPEMWAEPLWPLVAARTAPGGTLATFSAAGHVRRGLAAAGFVVEKAPGFGSKKDMTVAALPGAAPARAAPGPVTVIGAGLGGSAAAHMLARKGVKVTVTDRHAGPAGEASGNPLGVLYPKMTVDDSSLGRLHGHAFRFTRALLETLPLPSWTPCGVLHLDLDEEDAARTRALVERNAFPADYARRVEDAGEMAGIPLPVSALFQPSAGFLSPPEFCAALLDHPGISVVYGEEVESFGEGTTVFAPGAGGGALAESLGLPLRPLRGQVSLAEATTESTKLKTVLCHDGFFIPARDGLHCFGATFQREAYGAPALRAEDHAENLARLHANIPSLSSCARIAGGRAGFRATTPDKLPLAGLVRENLYVAAGFGAHGLSGAPLAGEIIAALVTGDPLPVPLTLLKRLAPGRFGAGKTI